MSKQKLNELIDKYKSTYSVPKHLKVCPIPRCGSKVIVYNMNHWDAVFMCSNDTCLWPLLTYRREQTFGKNDVQTYVEIRHEERKIYLKSGEKLETSFDSLWNLDETKKDVSPAKSATSCKQSKNKSPQKKKEEIKSCVEPTTIFGSSGKVMNRELTSFPKEICMLVESNFKICSKFH